MEELSIVTLCQNLICFMYSIQDQIIKIKAILGKRCTLIGLVWWVIAF